MRYLPHSPDELKNMMSVLGVSSEEELFSSIPQNQRTVTDNISKGKDEFNLRRELFLVSQKNKTYNTVLAGGGVYFHNVSSAVDHIISRTEFLTAYTPYQPEVSQGTLQSIFEFQTMVSELMGLEVANASLYDGASALGESLLMAVRLSKGKKNKLLVSRAINPLYLEVVNTMVLSNGNTEISLMDFDKESGKTILPETIGSDVAAIAIGYPNFFGVIEPIAEAAVKAHEAGALLITSVPDATLLGTLSAPGDLGCDICVSEGMSLAGTYGMGGPSIGLMATTKKYVKQMPGRIVGQTKDKNDERGYVLTLSTREQHIRRERATSNICSNQGLVALAFGVHASLLGSSGLSRVNALSRNRAKNLFDGLTAIDKISAHFNGPYFNEFVIDYDGDISELKAKLKEKSVLFGIELDKLFPKDSSFAKSILLCTTEVISKDEINSVIETVKSVSEGRA